MPARIALLRAALLGSLMLLGACNMVVTTKPLFTASDSAGVPQLKPGVWNEKPDPACAVDETKPLADWPSCAHGVIVQNGQIGAYSTDANGKRVWTASTILMVGGDPRVMQFHLPDIDLKGLGGAKLDLLYLYMALRPTSTDADGRVTAFTSWPIVCGPPPPDGTKSPDGKGVRLGTLTPLPGLVMDKAGGNCTPTSPAAVLAAAAPTEQWAKGSSLSVEHWVRDGTR